MIHSIAYISRIIYPKASAHALQAMQMAAAFARVSGDADIFVRDLVKPWDEIRHHYNLGGSPLRLWSLHNGRLPGPLQGYYGHAAVFNTMVAAILAFHLKVKKSREHYNILFNRMEHEAVYWGRMRPYLPWMKDWIFVHEAHDIAGLDSQSSLEENPFHPKDPITVPARQRLYKALLGYDLIICVTQALADDLKRWSDGALTPRVVRHASSLSRLEHSPIIAGSNDRIVLGYTGSVDVARGVDVLVKAMRLLPENYCLRLVGLNLEVNKYPAWLAELMEDSRINKKVELIPMVPLRKIACEINQCDILMQPASADIISLRYRAPLKLFDYMVRGKPIIAADVPCHRELLQDEVNACLYRFNDVAHLVERIQYLAQHPLLMESIAHKAWEQSADYTYDARARQILELVDGMAGRKR